MNSRYLYVGRRIKNERLKYNLSLNELAAAVGLSPSYLSLLENGKTSPSLKVIDKICNFFSIHISSLFSENEKIGDVFFFPREKHVEVRTHGDRIRRFLLPRGELKIEPVLVTLFPREKKSDPTVHKGSEFGYVIRGTVEFYLEGHETVICREGDSIIYNSSIRHVLHNSQEMLAEALLIGVPGVDFRDDMREIHGVMEIQKSAKEKEEEK